MSAPEKQREKQREKKHAEKRADLVLIATLVEPKARVLDIGCGTGDLLAMLARDRHVDGRGMELGQEGVNACVARGLSVVQGDADRDLADYPDSAFDWVILSQTLQATHRPAEVLRQMLRIGRRAIVSFPNFGCWRVRLDLLRRGRMPVTPHLRHHWHETPNIHLCTVNDFTDLCSQSGYVIAHRAVLNARGVVMEGIPPILMNLLAEQALFVLKRR